VGYRPASPRPVGPKPVGSKGVRTSHAHPTQLHPVRAHAAQTHASQVHASQVHASQVRAPQIQAVKARPSRVRRGATALLALAAIGLSLGVAALITNSGAPTLASAALPGSDRASFADRFFLSAKIAEGAALQPLKRYVMARMAPTTTAREALASRWMPTDFRASISDQDVTQLALPKIADPASVPITTASTTTSGIPMPRARPAAADQQITTTTQALALAAAPVNRPAERSLLQKFSDMVSPSRMTMASLNTGPNLFGKGPDLSLFGYDGATAVYDLKAHALYLPNGTVFEAHSGMGAFRDDPEHVDVRMQGATPPAVYSLKPREREFHGVAALRMTVADGTDINGRSGLLVHSFMLGPNGDSNGCISVKDYDRFLRAYNDGQFTHIAVVPSLKAVAETLAAQADPG
jgi:hypothetical protein